MKLIVCAVLLFSLPLTAQELEKKPSAHIDTYGHIGILNSPDTPDEVRMLGLIAAAIAFPIGDLFTLRVGSGSILGLIGPSQELSVGVEFFPLGSAKTSPLIRIGGRGIWNIAVQCANDDTCEPEPRVAGDAFGPLLAGGVGEASAGFQVKIAKNFLMLAWGSYLAGYLTPVGADNPLDSGGFYHGWLGHIAAKFLIF